MESPLQISLPFLPAELFSQITQRLPWWHLAGLALVCKECLRVCEPRLRGRRRESGLTPGQIEGFVRDTRSAMIFRSQIIRFAQSRGRVSNSPLIRMIRRAIIDKYDNRSQITTSDEIQSALTEAAVLDVYGIGILPVMRKVLDQCAEEAEIDTA